MSGGNITLIGCKSLLPNNSLTKFPVTTDKSILFFYPHCQASLRREYVLTSPLKRKCLKNEIENTVCMEYFEG